jgi:hypothetical protein
MSQLISAAVLLKASPKYELFACQALAFQVFSLIGKGNNPDRPNHGKKLMFPGFF